MTDTSTGPQDEQDVPRRHAEDPAEGADDTQAAQPDQPRESDEDPAEG